MRALFSFAGGSGHGEPLMPIARAAREAGHEVLFACEPWMVERVAASGFSALAVGTTEPATAEMLPLLEYDPAREDDALRRHFAGTLARERSVGVASVVRELGADVIVCDEVDLGAVLAAEFAGVPLVRVLVIAAGGFLRREVIGPPLDGVRREVGLRPDPQLAALSRAATIVPVPPSFRDPADPCPPDAVHIRPAAAESAGDVPPWVGALAPDVPRVYATLGTIFNLESGDLFRRLLDGLARVTGEAVLTTGTQLDPAHLGDIPSSIVAVRYVPQAAILGRCDVVVSHAGSGSVLGALTHGLPSVLLPIGADQPLNARRCAALGLGVVLDPLRASPRDIADAIETVRRDDGMRSRARAMAEEIAALPGPEAAVALVEGRVRRS